MTATRVGVNYRPVPEILPHTNSRGLVVLNAIARGLCDRVVRRFDRKPVRPSPTG
jgi:hypothetical protein